MKLNLKPFLAGACLLGASHSLVAAEISGTVDVYLGDTLLRNVTITPSEIQRFWLNEKPETIVEIRLVAPAPLIFDVKETDEAGTARAPATRVRLAAPGSTVALPEEAPKHAFRFVRVE